MSAITVINALPIDTNMTNTVKTPVKTPVLAAKYQKFLVFGHWFAQQVALDGIDIQPLQQRLRLFDSVESQTEFFQTFLDQSKEANKQMKATVRAFNKPPKTTKTTKNIPLTDNNDPSQPEKPALKRGRKKKEVQVVTNFQDDFVAEIVALANDRVVSNDSNDLQSNANDLQSNANDLQSNANDLQSNANDKPAEDKPKRKYVRKPKSAEDKSAEEQVC
jgi:hypothetical protein